MEWFRSSGCLLDAISGQSEDGVICLVWFRSSGRLLDAVASQSEAALGNADVAALTCRW